MVRLEPFRPIGSKTHGLKIGPYWYVYYDGYTRHRILRRRSGPGTSEFDHRDFRSRRSAHGNVRVSNEILAALKKISGQCIDATANAQVLSERPIGWAMRGNLLAFCLRRSYSRSDLGW